MAEMSLDERARPAPVDVRSATRTPPVKVWAVVGFVIFVFEAWVILRWVTGPFFKTVPVGPSEVPGYMKVAMMFWQVISIPAALGMLYWYVVRPWRRDRHIGVDGMLCIAFATMWFQDPLSGYFGNWFTYNAWQVNYGSWTNSIPGWLGYGTPGHMVIEPVLTIPALYVYFHFLGAVLGCVIMRRVQRRFPGGGRVVQLAACFVVLALFDVFFEVLWMPLTGMYAYPGSHGPHLFPGTFHQYPLHEAVFAAADLTFFAYVRNFLNDRGESIADRGIDGVKSSALRKNALRAFAMIGVVQVGFFVTFSMGSLWIGAHASSWPEDLQKRSYFTDGICGAGTDRVCPGPNVPLIRNDNSAGGGGSIRLGPLGKAIVPPNTTAPRIVPFDKGPLGPKGD